ncbi:MAG: transposase [Amphritea sp.]
MAVAGSFVAEWELSSPRGAPPTRGEGDNYLEKRREVFMPATGNSSALRNGRFSEAGRVYLVTFTTADRLPWFSGFEPGRIVVSVLKNESQFSKILAFVVMPDHVHWLVQLERKSLYKTVQTVKSVSAHRMNRLFGRSGSVWQDGFHDHAVRKDEDILHLARYVVMNPVRAGLVDPIRRYPFWDAVWL